MPASPDHSDRVRQSAEPRPPRWPWVPVLFVVAVQLTGIATLISHGMKPSGGLTISPHPGGMPSVGPGTPQALAAMKRLARHILLLEVNGHKLPRGSSPAQVQALFSTRPGSVNQVVLLDGHTRQHRLRLTAGPVDWPTLLRWYHWRVIYWVVGLLFLALGLFVWRRLPNDPGVRAFLMFMLVPPAHSVLAVYGEGPGLLLIHLQVLIFPLYGLGILNFALRFTGRHRHPWWRRVMRAFVVLAALLSTGLTVAIHMLIQGHDVEPVVRTLFAINSVQLGLSVVLVFVLTWSVWRRPGPAGLRRRARVLGWATLISFLFPSLWSFIGHHVTHPGLRLAAELLQFSVLAVFPLMIGYAILRLQMFSLRVVLSKGVVYAGLSVLVSLVYVAVILGVQRVAGSYRQLPLVSALSLVLFVVLFSLLKVRIQEAVDRVVFRSRYVYAEAMATASARLARAQGLNAVSRAVRLALVQGMGLSRVYLALWDNEEGEAPVHLRAIPIAAGERRGGEDLVPLPERFDPLGLPPVSRAIMERRSTTAYDQQAFSDPDTDDQDRARGEAEFWHGYGLERVTPLMGHEANARVVGLLLLGPKNSGHALDSEDQRLLSTLSNQVAMAIENSLAFEQIQGLKDNLEAQVAGRTSELTHTLMELHETQAQLIEHQTNAMLARVVAGVVHEINSPLGVLHSSADTVQRIFDRCRKYVEQEQQRAGGPAQLKAAARLLRVLDKGGDVIDTMDKSSERIVNVVNSLQKFVSLDEAEYKTVDVRDGLETTLLLLSPRLEDRVQVVREFTDEKTLVSCYPAMLNQVFLKLLENGIDAVDEGGRLELSVKRRGRWVVIAIADNGRGIPKKELPRLFEFGFTRKSGGRIGMRMGLAYVKSTIDKFGGRLKIDSAVGQGTTVTIQLLAAGWDGTRGK